MSVGRAVGVAVGLVVTGMWVVVGDTLTPTDPAARSFVAVAARDAEGLAVVVATELPNQAAATIRARTT